MIEIITSPRPLPGRVSELIKHGCNVELTDDCSVVRFPEGCKRGESYNVTGCTCQYELVFPDGYKVVVAYDWVQEKYFLHFYRELFGK